MVLPELQAALDAMAASDNLTLLTTEAGRQFKSAASFGGWFRKRCDEAGVNGYSIHGLRKYGATRLAELGCTDHEIMAWGGWTSIRMVQLYTRTADRKRLARSAMDRVSKART
jgi:integrase